MTALTPTGGLLVAGADGGVFCFDGAQYFGSLPGLHVTPAKPICGIASSPTGRGYWLVGQDGGVFAFGDASYEGNGIGKGPFLVPCVGLEPLAGGGYTLVWHATGGVPTLTVCRGGPAGQVIAAADAYTGVPCHLEADPASVLTS